MDYSEDPDFHISKCRELLEIQEKMYLGAVDEDILQNHILGITHVLEFLATFLEVSKNEDLTQRIGYLVINVKKKLYSLTYHGKDGLIMNLEHEYVNLRADMKNVIIKPGTNEYDVIFPVVFTRGYVLKETGILIYKKIIELLNSDYDTDITPIMKELEDIRKMLKLLQPIFEYAEPFDVALEVNEGDEKIFTTVAAVIERATGLIYFSFIGDMDDEMVCRLKYGLSDLVIEEADIMKMYLTLNTYSIDNLKSHISMSLRLLKWNKIYLGPKMGAALVDHFINIKHGLQFLVVIQSISKNKDIKLRIQHIVTVVKQKLYSLPNYQKGENLLVNLGHAYGELREEMLNVVIKPGTKDYDILFDGILKSEFCIRSIHDFLLEKITMKLGSLRFGAYQIADMMKELEGLRKKLTSLRPLIDYLSIVKEEGKKILAPLTIFLGRATCLIYVLFVATFNEDVLVSMIENFSSLIKETEIKEMSLVLGIILEDELEADIIISLSLLEGHREYYKGSINEAIWKDHIMSLKHGIQMLKWLDEIYTDRDLKRHIVLLAGNVKHKLELITDEQGDESVNLNVIYAYDELREEMKNLIINPATGNYDFLSRKKFVMKAYSRSNADFLLEKITTLVTSNFKADQIAPLKRELQDFRKMLIVLKPLGFYIAHKISFLRNGYDIFTNFFTLHHKAASLIYFSFVAKMDTKMMHSVKSDISAAVKETDILEMYIMILNAELFSDNYLDLFLLDNLILLLKINGGSLYDLHHKLYEVFIDIRTFLLGLHPNVLTRKLHLLQSSFRAILGHSIPIICSCYGEHTEVDISAELNCVLDLIKHIKCEAHEIKLYYFPRVDYLGFLEFFLGYLADLMENQEISIKEAIVGLHFEVGTLLPLIKVTNQELSGTPWIDIIDMAYQAEYIVDLYLVSSPRNLELITSLSKIIKQLNYIRKNLNDGVTWDFSHLHSNLPALDGATTSEPQVLDNDAIVGLEEESKIITEYLLAFERKLDVISIVGMVGVGKTTLALTLYNNPLMADHFDILAWCTVSQSYQNRDVLLSIIDQVNGPDKSQRSISDDEALTDHLSRSLRKRRYLIVLDDIWDTALWNYLKRYLPNDRNGSRILITTWNKDVADQIGGKVNGLNGLSEEICWQLFQKRMIKEDSLSDVLKISKGIVEHCKGLPLSIVLIAGILSDIQRTDEKWNEIAESVCSLDSSDPQRNCKVILEIIYSHLDNHLRSCFLYLGLFPENEEIQVKRLTNLWIAEGLVQDTKSESAEEVARKYVEDLIVNGLVIPAKEISGGGVKTFRLHGLLREFCLHKVKEKKLSMLVDDVQLSMHAQDNKTTSKPQVLDNDMIVGLKEEAKIITEYLLVGKEKLDAISIVGMAGVGKTTLALTVYNNPLMAYHFDILAWCTVSQSYQKRDVLLSIIDQVNGPDKSQRSIWDDEALADHLTQSLRKRRYLIVLDDIWDTTLWNYLKRCLRDDRAGSRILITTRNKDVAEQIRGKVNVLNGLSEESSWQLFQKRITNKESLSVDLLKISKGIVEHCKGLPLSIVIVAGILSEIERTKKKWDQIATSMISVVLLDPVGKCKAILDLSYNHLPNHLRPCFLYLGSFPEDQEIFVDHLINLWIGEGLVRDTKSDKAEEVGKKYVEDLIEKSLVIPAKGRSRGGVETFLLHDLLRDFCVNKAKEQHFFTLLDKRNYSRPLHDPRRLFINGTSINELRFSCHSIRSMICYGELEASEIEKRIDSCDMVLLKVLEVGEVRSERFPDISSLIHLRYLSLGLLNLTVSVLPSPISKLRNLRILILRCRYNVIEVPDSVWDMVNLRNVDISREASFQIDRNRLENSSYLLKNLRSLSKAHISCGNSEWLSKLSWLQSLSCVLMNDPLKDNQFRMLSFNDHLTSLKMENAARWKQRFRSTCQLPSTLRELTLSKFFLKSDDITAIGNSLPHLQVFKIYSCYVPSGYQWNVVDEDFPELKVLKLRDLAISKWVVSEDSFLNLEELWVEKCSSLEEIPLEFGNIMKLHVISVRDCSPSVDESARQIENMQHECQNIEMRVLYQSYPSFNRIRPMISSDRLEGDGSEKGTGSSDMVLPKVLEIDGVQSNVFPNIPSLFHLRYLSLDLMKEEVSVFPLSITKLQNLQILILRCGYAIRIPDLIWNMVKLRHVDLCPEASFEIDRNKLQNSSVLLENLRSLSKARVSCGDSKWLSKLSGMQRLSCVFVDDDVEVNDDLEVNDDIEEDDDLELDDAREVDGDLEVDDGTKDDDDLDDNQFQMLSFNRHLTSLKVENASRWKQRSISHCQLPSSLRKLTLSKFFLKSNDISAIGKALTHLEVFKIYSCYIPSGYKWIVDDEDFPGLKVLKLRDLSISKWIASEVSFPSLVQLWVEKCDDLDRIPLKFGDLPMLRLITVIDCAPSVDVSARAIQVLQHEEQNNEMRVHIHRKKR